MPIKTMHMNNTFHHASGGIRTFYINMLKAANRKRRHMRLLVPAEKTEVEDVGEFGRIYYVKAPRFPFFDRRYRQIYPYRFLNPYAKAVWPLLRSEQPDLLEISDKYSLCYIASLLREGWFKIRDEGRPTVVGMSCERMDDNIGAFMTNSEKGVRFARWYMKFVHGRQFDAYIANSHYTAGEILDCVPAETRSRVYVRPRGVDCDLFTPERRSPQARRKLQEWAGGDSSSILLAYAGRLSPEKNGELLIDLMKRLARDPLHDFRMLIAGAGPLQSKMEAESRRLFPGRVVFLGHVGSRANLADLYANCDAFIHPNPREPFGIAPLEALACGASMVAPDAGGILSYASQDNSWLTQPDAASFEDALRRLLADPEAKRQAARRMALQHQWENVTDSWFDLYDRIHEERLAQAAGSEPSAQASSGFAAQACRRP